MQDAPLTELMDSDDARSVRIDGREPTPEPARARTASAQCLRMKGKRRTGGLRPGEDRREQARNRQAHRTRPEERRIRRRRHHHHRIHHRIRCRIQEATLAQISAHDS